MLNWAAYCHRYWQLGTLGRDGAPCSHGSLKHVGRRSACRSQPDVLSIPAGVETAELQQKRAAAQKVKALSRTFRDQNRQLGSPKVVGSVTRHQAAAASMQCMYSIIPPCSLWLQIQPARRAGSRQQALLSAGRMPRPARTSPAPVG